MQVRDSDEDDRNKLSHMMRSLYGIPNLTLTIRSDRTNIFKLWVDGFHGVHPNCRVHMGSNQSLGKVSIVRTSTKQKLNTTGSNETYLVALDYIIPHAM